jgi:hypothetical protein
MTSWQSGDLARIANSDDLHVAPFRDDGATYGTPTWIWSVVVGSSLYVRAYNGTRSRWYQAATSQRAGRITAAGQTFEVAFEAVENPVSASVQAEVDAAYRAKYAGSPYLGHMISSPAKAATVRITPRADA